MSVDEVKAQHPVHSRLLAEDVREVRIPYPVMSSWELRISLRSGSTNGFEMGNSGVR